MSLSDFVIPRAYSRTRRPSAIIAIVDGTDAPFYFTKIGHHRQMKTVNERRDASGRMHRHHRLRRSVRRLSIPADDEVGCRGAADAGRH